MAVRKGPGRGGATDQPHKPTRGKKPPKLGQGKQPKKQKGPSKAQQQKIYQGAITKLQGELIKKGLDPGSALKFAELSLSKAQGVSIGKGGLIHYKGRAYNAADFAHTPLIDYVTGAKAQAENKAALESDPVYQQTLANLGLNRDQSLAQLSSERRNSLIDFGDPSFVTGDPVLAAAVKANPFSTSNLLAEANRRNVSNMTQNANMAGTIFGGGLVSGTREANRQNSADQADALTKLTRYLTENNMQQTNIGQTYDLGQRNALVQAQQALTSAGLFNASTAPNLKAGGFKLFRPPHQGGGAITHPPPPPPRRGGQIRQGQHQPGANPPRAGGNIPPPPAPPHPGRIMPGPNTPWNPNQWHPGRRRRIGIPRPPRAM